MRLKLFAYVIIGLTVLAAASCSGPKSDYAVCPKEGGDHATIFDFEKMEIIGSDTRHHIASIRNAEWVGIVSPFQLGVPLKAPSVLSGPVRWAGGGYTFTATLSESDPKIYIVRAEPPTKTVTAHSRPRTTIATYSINGDLVRFRRIIEGPDIRLDTTVVSCGWKPINFLDLVPNQAS
jgi:hypothetical protein